MSLIYSLLMTEKDIASCVVLIKTLWNGVDEIVSPSEGSIWGKIFFKLKSVSSLIKGFSRN